MTIATDFTVLGIVGYNGYQFPPSWDGSCTMDAHYDESGRTISYYVMHFHFEWWIQSSNQLAPSGTDGASSTDSQMETIRDTLMTAGRDFQYATAGLGVIDVNRIAASPATPKSIAFPAQGSVNDFAWGPKPLRLYAVASNAKAVKLAFDIDVAIYQPYLSSFKFLLEFCFSIAYSVKDGYQSRTYTGYLRIPSVRGINNPNTLGDNADLYLDKGSGVLPQTPTGFRRVTTDRKLSMDKCRLDFTVVDSQVESTNYPPRNVVNASGSHGVDSGGPKFNTWSGAFEGTYEYARGISPAEGFPVFVAWLKDRLNNTDAVAKQFGKLTNLDGSQSPMTGATIIPTRLSMTEPNVYDRGRGTFRLSYTFVLGAGDIIKYALAASGLWRPVPGSDYDTWANSMKSLKVWSPRGYAQLAFQNTDDLIINICAKQTTPVVPTSTATLDTKQPGLPPSTGTGGPSFPIPAPDNSFVNYKLEFIALPRHSVSELKPLPSSSVVVSPKSVDVKSQDGYRPPYQSKNPSVFQLRNNPSMRLTMAGWALRAGYTVTPPEIVQVMGQTSVPAPGAGDFARTRVVGNCLGIPLVLCVWRKTYAMPDVPATGLMPPSVPTLGGPVSSGGGGIGGGPPRGGPTGFITF